MQENIITKNIVAYNLYDFLVEIQKGIIEGYRLSEKNEYFPQGLIGLYTCTLVKEEKPVVKPATFVADIPTLSCLNPEKVAEKKQAGRPKVQK